MQMNSKELQGLRKILYRKSFYEFFKWSFHLLEPENDLIETPHLKELCNILQEETFRILRKEKLIKNLLINIPPRTMKSMISTVIWPVYNWLINPAIKIVSISYNQDLATSMSFKSKILIQHPKFVELFSDDFNLRSDSKAKDDYTNNHNGFRKAIGLGGGITGRGFDILILDDIQDPSMAYSKAETKRVIDYWRGTLSTRKDQPWAIFVNIQQRLSQNDLTQHIIDHELKRFKHICLPAIITKNTSKDYLHLYKDNYLTPRLGPEELEHLRDTMGPHYFAGQFLQSPTANEGDLIKRDWLEISHDVLPENIVFNFFIDTAKGKEKGDGTAILAAAVYNNILYVKFVESNQLQFHELKSRITNIVKTYGKSGSAVYIESATIGDVLARELKRIEGLNMIDLSTQASQGKGDKFQRVYAQQAYFASKRIKLLYGDWNNNYIEELIGFPNMKHDDCVDVTIMAVNRLLALNNQTRYTMKPR